MNKVMNIKKLTITAVIALIAVLISLGGGQLLAGPPDVPPGLEIAMEVQEAHTPSLMENPDVVGTAIGLDEFGEPVIQVFTSSEGVRGIPRNIEGFQVDVKVTGPIVAYKGKPSSGVSHKSKQATPIQLGTSGGWRYDLANGYCCSGTLGSLVTDGTNQYILSNWHVLYSDIVNGGNGRTAQTGDPVIQPGLIDISCNSNNAQNVAALVSGGGSLPNSNVDAGIAAVIPGMVMSDGAILEIGTISSSTVAASISQAVKKSGRTTGLSRSSISGLNATVNITYDNECAGGTAFTKTFTGQIVIKNSRCGFLNGGDSGSLMVQDVTTNPRAVGLLYAGSWTCSRSAVAIANPINDVLDYFGVTMVGNP
jgi:hypothetical protein